MKRLCFLFSILMMMSSVAHSQSQNPDTTLSSNPSGSGAPSESSAGVTALPLLSKITFSGLKRTKESFLLQELSIYLNRPFTQKALNNLEADLQAMNIFSTITIKQEILSDSSLELFIAVTEKISFIPLPFAMYSSSTGFMGGGFIMDMNADGRKNMFVTGLILSADRAMVMGTYTHPAKIGHPGLSSFASFSRQNSKIRNSDGENLLNYNNISAHLQGSLLFKLNRYNNASLGLGYSGSFPDETDFHPDIYTRNKGSASAGWNISDKNWNGVFLSETILGTKAEVSLDNKSRLVSEFTAAIKIQQPFTQKLRVNIDAGAGLVLNPLITDGLGKSSARVTILDDRFSTDRIAGLSSGLEYAFLQTKKIGTFSLYGDYQFLFAKDFDDSLLFCQGFNTGMKVYMKGLAFPAVSMGLAYNATKNKYYFSGSFGVSF